MFRIMVCYQGGEGKTFDMEYYRTQHREIVERNFETLDRFEIDQAVDGPFMAVGHLYFASMEDLQASTSAPGAAEAQDDIKNFTNIEPMIQVSEVLD